MPLFTIDATFDGKSLMQTSMKKSLFSLLAILLTSGAFAKVEMCTYYFKTETNQLTESSLNKILELKYSMVIKKIQIIEVNSYSERYSDNQSNFSSAQSQADYVANLLEIQDENFGLNIYGDKRIELMFQPKNWNRIDIYYSIEEINTIVVKESIIKVSSSKRLVTENSKLIKEVVIDDYKVREDFERVSQPIVLPILFAERKTKITLDSELYLRSLYDTLIANPELSLHIRGHVCCSNKMNASKRRAKTVYRYLLTQGIDKKRLTFNGYSNTIPLVYPERTLKDRSANRRVDAIFIKQ